MKQGVTITTERFILRELTVDDVSPRYLAWFGDSDAVKNIVVADRMAALEDLRDYIRARAGRDDVLFLGIFDAATGVHLGNIKYEPVNSAAGWAIMGVLIGERAYRGKGVTPEALAASARWLQAHCGIRQVLLRVYAENTAAVRSYEKAGFVVEYTPCIGEAFPGTDNYPGTLTMVWHL